MAMTLEVQNSGSESSTGSDLDEISREIQPPSSNCWKGFEIPARYVMAILAFFGFVLNYMLRINMSIAIVAMVKRNSSLTGSWIESHNVTGEYNKNEEGEFEWDDKVQSLITGSFFWGYVLTQIPGGRFAEMFGSKYIFGMSIFLSGLLTMLVPLAAAENPTKLICLRVLLGILEGATYPSMHAMLARWAPPTERSRLTSIVYSGSQAGTVLTLPLGGFIISAWGWRPMFYIMGGLPVIWILFWLYFVYDFPETHPRINPTELKYLQESLRGSTSSRNKCAKVPWVQIGTSLPFYAILIAGIASNWGFWTLLTLLPTYMKTMLGFDIKQNSLLSSVPYLTMWFFGVVYSLLADYLSSSGVMKIRNIRKLSTFICLGLPACAIFSVTFVDVQTIPTVALFTLGVGFCGAKYSSYLSNHIDIAPNYAGTLLGIANAISTIPGWLAPLTAAALTNGHQTLEQWHKVFYIASAIYILGFLFFLIFASGEVQTWNQTVVLTEDATFRDEISSAENTDAISISPSSSATLTKYSILNHNYAGIHKEA